MSIAIGNAPVSWGIEVPDAASNTPWGTVLDETSGAGYSGTELGPVGYIPEDVSLLEENLQRRGLTLIGSVLFRPFHDEKAWDELLDALHRTGRMLQPLDAKHLVFIDSVTPERTPYAGNSDAAPRLPLREVAAMHDRIRTAARIGREEYGLSPSLHAHAGGYIEFKDELEHTLDAVDEDLLKICLDTGHSLYSGFDPIALFRRYSARIDYIHLKDIDAAVLQRSVAERIGFYEACARGVFCNLGQGVMDFVAFKGALQEAGYEGWATVEQDRGPLSLQSAFDDARASFEFLRSIGLAE